MPEKNGFLQSRQDSAAGSGIEEFKKTVLEYYAGFGRVFPWRLNLDPWGILVSEYMLQQTQTGRVIPYWEKFLTLWPAPASLAAAPLEEVLAAWSGLGYNRRAKNLWNCAKAITERHGGAVPKTQEELILLPGAGPYTAGAIACFAWNYPAVFIETNIRAALIHFFFQGKADVHDNDLRPFLEQSLDRQNPRRWYWALMDYGAELKKITANPNRKSAHYSRQSRFKGSFRELRGAVIRQLALHGSLGAAELLQGLEDNLEGIKREDFYRAVDALKKEMMVAEEEGEYRISG